VIFDNVMFPHIASDAVSARIFLVSWHIRSKSLLDYVEIIKGDALDSFSSLLGSGSEGKLIISFFSLSFLVSLFRVSYLFIL